MPATLERGRGVVRGGLGETDGATSGNMAEITLNTLPLKNTYKSGSQNEMVGWLVLVAKSCPTLETPWTVTHQAPLSMGLPRQEYWSGLPFPSPGDLPDPEIKLRSPVLQADSLLPEPPGKPRVRYIPLNVRVTFQSHGAKARGSWTTP